MKNSGLYQIFTFLPVTTEVKVGKLGSFTFVKGSYIYTGSAKSGLQARVSRHLSKRKKMHWHLDYFLRHAFVTKAHLYYEPKLTECMLNKKTSESYTNAIFPVKGFGASDCNCYSHLIYLKDTPN
ncbi:MAG: GIY-YIG nuclease family protein [Clostridia bacterium]